jgi:hypothetical protein
VRVSAVSDSHVQDRPLAFSEVEVPNAQPSTNCQAFTADLPGP